MNLVPKRDIMNEAGITNSACWQRFKTLSIKPVKIVDGMNYYTEDDAERVISFNYGSKDGRGRGGRK